MEPEAVRNAGKRPVGDTLERGGQESGFASFGKPERRFSLAPVVGLLVTARLS